MRGYLPIEVRPRGMKQQSERVGLRGSGERGRSREGLCVTHQARPLLRGEHASSTPSAETNEGGRVIAAGVAPAVPWCRRGVFRGRARGQTSASQRT